MTKPGPSVTSGADTQPGSDSLFPSGFGGSGGATIRASSVGTSEIADGSVAAADLNLASVAPAIAARTELTGVFAQTVQAPTGVAATDTAAIQGAINTAATAGGGIIRLRAGTYVVNKLTLKTGVTLRGEGRYATVLKLANGVNDNLVETLNFSTLTGTDTSSTPNSFGIEELTLDGNKTNQTSGTSHTLAIYAYGWHVAGVIIKNARNRGIWTEWATASPFLSPDGMEALVTDFKIHDCDDGAIYHKGPHDAQFHNGLIVVNSGYKAGQKAIEIPTDGRANGSIFVNVHVYGGAYDYGAYNASSGILFADCQFEGAQVAQMWIDASINQVEACKLFSGGVSASTVKGIVVGHNSATVNNLRIRVKVENCGGGVLDLTYSGGDHDIDLFGQYYGGVTVPSPAVIGSYDANGRYNIQVVNGSGVATSDSQLKLPVRMTVPTITATNLTVSGRASGPGTTSVFSDAHLTARIDCCERQFATGNNSLTGGFIAFIYFTPESDFTVNNIGTATRGTLASGLTLAKYGLFSVDASGNLTCIARTASDTTLWAVNNTVYPKAIVDNGAASPSAISSVAISKGGRYAVGVLAIGTTMPQIISAGWGAASSYLFPAISGITTGSQTDIPASLTVGQVAGGMGPYAYLT